MTWKGESPEVHRIAKGYAKEQAVGKAEMKIINDRLQRSAKLPKYDVSIKPTSPRGR